VVTGNNKLSLASPGRPASRDPRARHAMSSLWKAHLRPSREYLASPAGSGGARSSGSRGRDVAATAARTRLQGARSPSPTCAAVLCTHARIHLLLLQQDDACCFRRLCRIACLCSIDLSSMYRWTRRQTAMPFPQSSVTTRVQVVYGDWLRVVLTAGAKQRRLDQR